MSHTNAGNRPDLDCGQWFVDSNSNGKNMYR